MLFLAKENSEVLAAWLLEHLSPSPPPPFLKEVVFAKQDQCVGLPPY